MEIETFDKINKVVLIVSIIAFFFFLIIYPSYVSYSHYIGKEAFLSNYLSSKEPGGIYYPSTDTIVLNTNSTIVLRHELTHRKWNQSKDSFVEELDCYIEMYFIWNKVNLTTLNWSK